MREASRRQRLRGGGILVVVSRQRTGVVSSLRNSIPAGNSTRSIFLETFPTPHYGPEPITLDIQRDPPPLDARRDINTNSGGRFERVNQRSNRDSGEGYIDKVAVRMSVI